MRTASPQRFNMDVNPREMMRDPVLRREMTPRQGPTEEELVRMQAEEEDCRQREQEAERQRKAALQEAEMQRQREAEQQQRQRELDARVHAQRAVEWAAMQARHTADVKSLEEKEAIIERTKMAHCASYFPPPGGILGPRGAPLVSGVDIHGNVLSEYHRHPVLGHNLAAPVAQNVYPTLGGDTVSESFASPQNSPARLFRQPANPVRNPSRGRRDPSRSPDLRSDFSPRGWAPSSSSTSYPADKYGGVMPPRPSHLGSGYESAQSSLPASARRSKDNTYPLQEIEVRRNDHTFTVPIPADPPRVNLTNWVLEGNPTIGRKGLMSSPHRPDFAQAGFNYQYADEYQYAEGSATTPEGTGVVDDGGFFGAVSKAIWGEGSNPKNKGSITPDLNFSHVQQHGDDVAAAIATLGKDRYLEAKEETDLHGKATNYLVGFNWFNMDHDKKSKKSGLLSDGDVSDTSVKMTDSPTKAEKKMRKKMWKNVPLFGKADLHGDGPSIMPFFDSKHPMYKVPHRPDLPHPTHPMPDPGLHPPSMLTFPMIQPTNLSSMNRDETAVESDKSGYDCYAQPDYYAPADSEAAEQDLTARAKKAREQRIAVPEFPRTVGQQGRDTSSLMDKLLRDPQNGDIYRLDQESGHLMIDFLDPSSDGPRTFLVDQVSGHIIDPTNQALIDRHTGQYLAHPHNPDGLVYINDAINDEEAHTVVHTDGSTQHIGGRYMDRLEIVEQSSISRDGQAVADGQAPSSGPAQQSATGTAKSSTRAALRANSPIQPSSLWPTPQLSIPDPHPHLLRYSIAAKIHLDEHAKTSDGKLDPSFFDIPHLNLKLPFHGWTKPSHIPEISHFSALDHDNNALHVQFPKIGTGSPDSESRRLKHEERKELLKQKVNRKYPAGWKVTGGVEVPKPSSLGHVGADVLDAYHNNLKQADYEAWKANAIYAKEASHPVDLKKIQPVGETVAPGNSMQRMGLVPLSSTVNQTKKAEPLGTLSKSKVIDLDDHQSYDFDGVHKYISKLTEDTDDDTLVSVHTPERKTHPTGIYTYSRSVSPILNESRTGRSHKMPPDGNTGKHKGNHYNGNKLRTVPPVRFGNTSPYPYNHNYSYYFEHPQHQMSRDEQREPKHEVHPFGHNLDKECISPAQMYNDHLRDLNNHPPQTHGSYDFPLIEVIADPVTSRDDFSVNIESPASTISPASLASPNNRAPVGIQQGSPGLTSFAPHNKPHGTSVKDLATGANLKEHHHKIPITTTPHAFGGDHAPSIQSTPTVPYLHTASNTIQHMPLRNVAPLPLANRFSNSSANFSNQQHNGHVIDAIAVQTGGGYDTSTGNGASGMMNMPTSTTTPPTFGMPDDSPKMLSTTTATTGVPSFGNTPSFDSNPSFNQSPAMGNGNKNGNGSSSVSPNTVQDGGMYQSNQPSVQTQIQKMQEIETKMNRLIVGLANSGMEAKRNN